MNPLTSLPARVRQGLYVGYGLLVIVYGALTAAYLQDPDWLDVAGRVLTTLAVPFAALAATHVVPTPPEQPEGETFGSTAAERDEIDGWVADAPSTSVTDEQGRPWVLPEASSTERTVDQTPPDQGERA